MVDKFKKIIEQIKTDKKTLTLFAIMKMDEISDRWTVILCAPWASGQPAFEYVRKLIVTNFTQEELSSIARIGVFDKNTSLIQGLLRYKTGDIIESETAINGNAIHSAFVIESNPEV